MTDKLPPNLLALFAPRPPLRWVQPPDHAPEHRKTAPIDGIAAYLPELAMYEREYDYRPTESWLEARDRKKREQKEKLEKLGVEGPDGCMRTSHHRPFYFLMLMFCCFAVNPKEDPNIRGDPFKTLIVARLSYEATEKDLEREFQRFGPIERVRHPETARFPCSKS
jgi:U1 small nuclear ribonucleoprotein